MQKPSGQESPGVNPCLSLHDVNEKITNSNVSGGPNARKYHHRLNRLYIILMAIMAFDQIIRSNKYALFLISCVLIIVTSPFLGDPKMRVTINAITLVFSVITGLIVTKNRRGIKARVIRSLAYLTFTAQLITALRLAPVDVTALVIPAIYIVFFVGISLVVYTDIYRAKHVDTEMVAAVFCGFIMLGILCTFIFTIVEIIQPNSFSGLEDQSVMFNNLIYFSFVTLLTIGYGDMAPLTDAAKVTIVCVGLIGNFYTVFVTGIVIGKFISGRVKSK